MSRQIINTPKAPLPIGPYSQAIAVNGTLYVSGQIALDPESGELVQSSIEAETQRVLDNLTYVVQEAGYHLNDVVKCSIFLDDMSNFSLVNTVYEQYFDTVKPARETVAVAGLPKNVRVEISCIAVKPA